MGLTVSFNECFKRDTRCNASNISREINTFQSDSSTNNGSNVLSYCTEQFQEAKIFSKTEFFRLFRKTLLKRRGHIN